nr:hypothetical protein [Tanacetum cinerariifolium]
MELYTMMRQHGRMILESVENVPLIWPSIEENRVTRGFFIRLNRRCLRYQADCDNSTSHARNFIDETRREFKLYDEFDKFANKNGETLREFCLRFSLLLNDMNIHNMKLEQFQVNTKFLNTLPLEWSKFVTGVKLVRDLHTTNVDQLHAYLGQHEFHTNEYGSPYQSQQYSHTQSSTPLSITYPPNDFQVHHNVYSPSSSIPQVEYAPSVNQQPDFSQPDSGLIVLVFQKAVGTSRTYTSGASGNNSEKQRTVICYNYKGEADDLDAYNSDCDEINTAKVAIMANLSHYGSDDLVESETEITNDSNIIPYSQYVSESQQAAVQNSNSPSQQDAMILSVIEQLKTQVVNCTKINLDNKSVNDTLTPELERYKDQVRILKKGQNVRKDIVSDSCAQSVKIDNLKQTLSDDLKEKESLMQTITLLKNDFQKEESRNIDREIALDKQIKELNNIVFKRNQCAQTIHMLTKPQFFYDPTNKHAPETLMLAEESHSKMLLKQKDPMMSEKKVNTTPVDYAVLNQLS